MRLLALTDHDSVEGLAEAARAAERERIRLVAAVELSFVDGGHQDLHLLGYLIDPHDPALAAALKRARDERERRARAMARALAELGFAVDVAALEARLARGEAVGRPHVAAAVVGRPENRQRLAAAGLLDASAFLAAYLVAGRPAFAPRTWPEVGEALDVIHRAGGVAVWAHPFWDIPAPAEALATLERFSALGVDGVEAFYVTHTAEQTRLLERRARELGMLTTGSSDFHGPEHRSFDRFLAFETHGLEPRLGPIAG